MRLVDYPCSDRTFALARSCLGLLMIWVTAVQDLSGIPDLPPQWFVPIGPIALLPRAAALELLDPGILASIRWAGVALAILFATGIGPVPVIGLLLATVATCAQCLGAKAFSGGYATHTEIAAILSVALLSASAIGQPRNKPMPAAAAKAAMLSVALMIGILYLAIGAHRMARGAPEIFVGDSILAWQVSHSLVYSETGSQLGLLVTAVPALATASKLAFLVATVAELVAPLCLIMGARCRLCWLGVMVAMHIGTSLLMNVHFPENLALLMVFCSGLPQRLTRRSAMTAG